MLIESISLTSLIPIDQAIERLLISSAKRFLFFSDNFLESFNPSIDLFVGSITAAAKTGPFGVSRITRHASLWSFAFLSFGAGALRSVFAAEFALFFGPMYVIAMLAQHKDHRYRNGIGGEILASMEWPYSSCVPFAACVFGQQRITEAIKEMKPVNSAAAAGVTAAICLRRIKGVV